MKKKDTWFTMIQVAYDIFKRNKTQRVLQEVETHRMYYLINKINQKEESNLSVGSQLRRKEKEKFER